MATRPLVQAWSVDVNFGSAVGVHLGVGLLQYAQGGNVYMQLSTLGNIFMIPKTTLRDGLATQPNEHGYKVETRGAVLAVFKASGLVGVSASKVLVVRISQCMRLLHDATPAVDQHALKVLHSLAKSAPPPRPPQPTTPTVATPAQAMDRSVGAPGCALGCAWVRDAATCRPPLVCAFV
jgi:hypothetical protein